MHFNREHTRLLDRLGLSAVKDIEHFRIHVMEIPNDVYESITQGYRYALNPSSFSHYACLCLVDGAVYLGEAHTSAKDNYNRKRGYTIAVGRALRAAVDKDSSPKHFWVQPDKEGVALRDACRAALGLPPYQPRGKDQ